MSNGALSELRNKALMKKTLVLMLPIIMQQLISMGINFFDNIMIGHLGEIQISAVSQSNQFYSLVFYLGMGIGSGAIVMTSQFWGSKDLDSLKQTTSLALKLSFFIYLAFTLLALFIPGGILTVFSNDPDVIKAGIPYIRYIGVTFIMAGLASTSSYILRSVNSVRVPLIGSTVSFFLNIFFNWVFIFGKLGAPEMGIVGAGVGTLIARSFEFLFIFGHLILADKRINLRFPDLFRSQSAEIRKNFIHYSIPLVVSDTSLGVSLALVAVVLGHNGKEVTAAASIVNTVVQMLSILNMSISGAAAVVIGNTIGEGDVVRAKKEGNAYVMIALLLGLVLIIPLLLLEGPYLSLYSVSDYTRSIAHDCIIVNCFFLPMQMIAFMTSKGILRGGGDTAFLLKWDTILIWVVSLPLGALASFVWHLPPFWIYFLLRLEYPSKGLVCLIRFLSGKWINVIRIETSETSGPA
ncbi:MAG: MATE family efflux transporter [Lachnospiraceae bacterium]|nr:MATE family efflux transporter [Lachnospiraceae bacterium]